MIALRVIRARVEQAGYEGPVEVEIFSEGNWWRRDTDEVLGTVRERLANIG